MSNPGIRLRTGGRDVSGSTKTGQCLLGYRSAEIFTLLDEGGSYPSSGIGSFNPCIKLAA